MDAEQIKLLEILEVETQKVLSSAEAMDNAMRDIRERDEKADKKQADELGDESEGEGDEKDNEPE